MSGVLGGLIAAFPTPVTSSFESIASASGTGSSNTITFSSIPNTFVALQLRFVGRVANADTADNLFLQFNSDTASNYSWHYLEGDGGSVTAGPTANATKMLSGRVAAATATAGIVGAGIIDIHNYASTTQNKTVRSLTGIDRSGSGNVRMDSGLWRSTSAVTSIQITNGSATNFTTDTVIGLYGIKGA
jgi:hypothetical protein